jgi:hypothetical protein
MLQPSMIIAGDQIRDARDGREAGRILFDANALDEATWPRRVSSTSGLLVVRSGFSPDPADPQPLWLAGPRGDWARFAGHAQHLCATAGQTPVVWPRLGEVLSDAPSLLSFLRGAPAWRFVVEPLALLTPDMHRNAPEHLDRLAELLFGHHACAGVVVGADGPVSSLAALGKVLAREQSPIWVRDGEQAMLTDL